MANSIEIDLPDKVFFRIGEVAELVGVEPHVLRYWESEFNICPSRSASGQRMYQRKEISAFLRIQRLLHEQGFTIAGARKHLAGEGTESPGASVGSAKQLKEAIDRIDQLRAYVVKVKRRLREAASGETT